MWWKKWIKIAYAHNEGIYAQLADKDKEIIRLKAELGLRELRKEGDK